jgi:hypothetical protein
MIEGGELSLPFMIETKGGRSYTITYHANAIIPEAYPNTVILCVRERGIILLGLDAIEAIHHEHEVAAGR